MKTLSKILLFLSTIIFIIIMNVVGLVVVPIALLFTTRYSSQLPAIFYPWDNHEDTINGDVNWQSIVGKERFSYWGRLKWLAFRNPSHNYVKEIIGVKQPITYKYRGDDWETVSKKGGFHLSTINNKYCQVFFHNKYIYLRVGWKYEKVESCRFAFVVRRGRIV